MTDFLPPEFDPISHLVQYVHRKSQNEFCGSCPTCGGTVHQNGSNPDRFVMFRVGRYGFPLGFCRKCGYRWSPKTGKQPSQDDIEEWRRNQIEVEKARIESAKRSIELLQNDRVWERFFGQNNDWSRETFKKWGISDTWVKYLSLGLIPDFVVKNAGEQYHSPAFTIPVWNVGGVVQNIKLRMANPKEPRDRYRNFYPMGQSFLFVPLYDLPLTGAGVVMEGEKKAIVMEQALDDMKYRVVGFQTKTPAPELFEQLKNLDPIYICLDPDAFLVEGKGKESAADYMVRMLGRERCRIVQFPCKPDDGIVQHGLNPMKYIQMARQAR